MQKIYAKQYLELCPHSTGMVRNDGNDDEPIDVTIFLIMHDLPWKIDDALTQRKMTIEKLARFSENNLVAFGKDIGLNKAERQRFVRGIREIDSSRTDLERD